MPPTSLLQGELLWFGTLAGGVAMCSCSLVAALSSTSIGGPKDLGWPIGSGSVLFEIENCFKSSEFGEKLPLTKAYLGSRSQTHLAHILLHRRIVLSAPHVLHYPVTS